MQDKIKWHEYVQIDALHTPDGQFQHWVLYPLPSREWCRKETTATHTWMVLQGWQIKESDHLFGSGNRGQLEGGAQDMVVPDTDRVGG